MKKTKEDKVAEAITSAVKHARKIEKDIPIVSPRQQDWEKEFQKEISPIIERELKLYGEHREKGASYGNDLEMSWGDIMFFTESFIRSLLAHQKQEVIEEIRKTSDELKIVRVQIRMRNYKEALEILSERIDALSKEEI